MARQFSIFIFIHLGHKFKSIYHSSHQINFEVSLVSSEVFRNQAWICSLSRVDAIKNYPCKVFKYNKCHSLSFSTLSLFLFLPLCHSVVMYRPLVEVFQVVYIYITQSQCSNLFSKVFFLTNLVLFPNFTTRINRCKVQSQRIKEKSRNRESHFPKENEMRKSPFGAVGVLKYLNWWAKIYGLNWRWRWPGQ